MPDASDSGAGHSDEGSKPALKKNGRRKRSRTRVSAYGALDLGTNNCRLLIAKPLPEGFKVIDSFSRVVHLGAGLTSTGRLSDESMDMAVEAIGVCAAKMKAKNVKRWRCVATQACRQAENGDEFLARVKAETGLSLEVISPRVEARLSVMGCLHLVDPAKDVALVIDIGGGSTELSWVDIRKLKNSEAMIRVHRPPISAWASLPVGVVTLSERFPEHEDRTVWYDDMRQAVREAITKSGCENRFTSLFAQGQGQLIGTSGTITSLASVYQKLPYYRRDMIDGSTLPTSAAVETARELASMSIEQRSQVPSIGQDRARLLVAGCAITDVICELWPSDYIRVADRGLREGILLGLMGQAKQVRFDTSDDTCSNSELIDQSTSAETTTLQAASSHDK